MTGDMIRTTAGLLLFRWLVVGCQAATLLITWPLWQNRTSPPMLPALPLPAVDLGALLLLSLAVILIAPRSGIVLHTALLLYAVAIDQTRIQPEIVSLTFLLWGTLPSPTARLFARAHLISMWFFAGLHKLLSPGFIDDTSQWILSAVIANPPSWLSAQFGYLIALSELSIGLLALVPSTRRLAAVAAFGLHGGILFVLMPTGHDWNEAVWPWNVALAFSGFALIAPWKDSPRTCLQSCTPVLRPLLVLLVVAPLGFYAGVVDAYLSHNLYSSNTAYATVWCPNECQEEQQPSYTWQALNVPFPPEHRLFEDYFARTCQSGDEMTIHDSRWWFTSRGQGVQVLSCSRSA